MSWYGGYRPYVPVAKRRAQAAKEVAKQVKNGREITPVRIEGRKITATFWGTAWSENLESYSDYSNRLPRGRTYVRNGSVVHLAIEPGRITAMVSGSELYNIQIDIATLPKPSWMALKQLSAGKVGTLVELLQGKLSQAVMQLVTDRDQGLFPKPSEIKMRCSCPDSAGLCKHLAAVMYGVGNRLDTMPELLFKLRGVNHLELIEQAIPEVSVGTGGTGPRIDAADLASLFDIELDEPPVDAPVAPAPARSASRTPRRKAAAQPAIAPTIRQLAVAEANKAVIAAAKQALIDEANKALIAKARKARPAVAKQVSKVMTPTSTRPRQTKKSGN